MGADNLERPVSGSKTSTVLGVAGLLSMPITIDVGLKLPKAKGVVTTDIVDHGWAQSVYFKDPNGLSLEYCCIVRNLTEDDARMQERFTIPRGALDLNNALNGRSLAAQSAGDARKT